VGRVGGRGGSWVVIDVSSIKAFIVFWGGDLQINCLVSNRKLQQFLEP